MKIFRKEADYAAFLKLLVEGKEHAKVELFGFCLMSNHWHLILRPERDEDLAAYLSWVTNTHVKRYRSHYSKTSGHLYQGRFKSFPVQCDSYFLTALRYVEANPLRAGLVRDPIQWRWSSLGCQKELKEELLDRWPVDRPRDWPQIVKESLPQGQLERVRTSVNRGRPLGDEAWLGRMVKAMKLEFTLRRRGRPAKDKPEEKAIG